MKAFFKIIFLCGIIVFAVFSCKDNENIVIPEDRLLEVKDLITDGCKSDSFYLNMDFENANEYIELQSVDSNCLEVNHIDAVFNCYPSIDIQVKIENGAIIYSATDTFPIVNCNCLYDLSFIIGPLDYAQYAFEYHEAGNKICEFSFNFSSSTNEIFKIDKKNYYENNK